MSMTPEQQRVALAEWDQWEVGHSSKYSEFAKPDSGIWHLRHRGMLVEAFSWNSFGGKLPNPTLVTCIRQLPDYGNDLNAVFACQDKLTNEQVNVYVQHLLGSYFGSDLIGPCFRCATATVSQRREALCRTLWPERWKEAQ